MASPVAELRRKVKIFSKLSAEEKHTALAHLTNEDERKALKELMDVEASEKLLEQLTDQLQGIKQQQDDDSKRREDQEVEDDKTRHGKRVTKQF